MDHSKESEMEEVAGSRITASVTNSKEKVDRIRDIIFGAQIREYTQRFDTITRELARMNQEVTRLSTQMQEQEKRLRSEIRQESDRLSAQLQDQATAHQQQLQAFDQRFTEQLQLLDQKHTASAQSLAGNLAHVEQLLRDELHALSRQLNSAKADRSSLGDLLITLGSTLQNNEPAPLQVADHYLDQLSNELLSDDLLGDGLLSDGLFSEEQPGEDPREG